MCIHGCICMSVYMYVCIYVCLHICMSAYMYVCIYVCLHICMSAYMYVCIYVCTLLWLYHCVGTLKTLTYLLTVILFKLYLHCIIPATSSAGASRGKSTQCYRSPLSPLLGVHATDCLSCGLNLHAKDHLYSDLQKACVCHHTRVHGAPLQHDDDHSILVFAIYVATLFFPHG